jgi:hypothetical protein
MSNKCPTYKELSIFNDVIELSSSLQYEDLRNREELFIVTQG